jgi:hypothetical protein
MGLFWWKFAWQWQRCLFIAQPCRRWWPINLARVVATAVQFVHSGALPTWRPMNLFQIVCIYSLLRCVRGYAGKPWWDILDIERSSLLVEKQLGNKFHTWFFSCGARDFLLWNFPAWHAKLNMNTKTRAGSTDYFSTIISEKIEKAIVLWSLSRVSWSEQSCDWAIPNEDPD